MPSPSFPRLLLLQAVLLFNYPDIMVQQTLFYEHWVHAGVLDAFIMQEFYNVFVKVSYKFSISTFAAFNFNFGKILEKLETLEKLAYCFHVFNCSFSAPIYLLFWPWYFWENFLSYI